MQESATVNRRDNEYPFKQAGLLNIEKVDYDYTEPTPTLLLPYYPLLINSIPLLPGKAASIAVPCFPI